jgi:hypothetical protein
MKKLPAQTELKILINVYMKSEGPTCLWQDEKRSIDAWVEWLDEHKEFQHFKLSTLRKAVVASAKHYLRYDSADPEYVQKIRLK